MTKNISGGGWGNCFFCPPLATPLPRGHQQDYSIFTKSNYEKNSYCDLFDKSNSGKKIFNVNKFLSLFKIET